MSGRIALAMLLGMAIAATPSCNLEGCVCDEAKSIARTPEGNVVVKPGQEGDAATITVRLPAQHNLALCAC